MSNRLKVMILIGLFWIGLQTVLLLIGISSFPIIMFTILGSTITILIGMYLDVYNDKISRWFDSKEFF